MLLALEFEDHERARYGFSVFRVLGKFDLEPVNLRDREEFGYPELIMNLRKHEEVLGQHVAQRQSR